MSGFDILSTGDVVGGFFEAISTTFLGSWIYVLFLLGLDIAFALNVKSVEPVAIMNMLILFIFKSYFEPEVFYILMIVSIAALTIGMIKLFTSR